MALFNIRNSAPDVSNKFYRNVRWGGQSLAIPITQPDGTENGFTLPNCVGYANGRQNEVILEVTGNEQYVNNDMVRAADKIYDECRNKGRPVGFEPKIGGVMCWKDGNPGHVAYVERRDNGGTGNGVLLTWSDFGGKVFTKRWLYKDQDGPGWNFWGQTYQGCVYNYDPVQRIIDDTGPGPDPEPPTPPGDKSPEDYMRQAWLCLIGKYGNISQQKSKLEGLGYTWNHIVECKKIWKKWYGYYN